MNQIEIFNSPEFGSIRIVEENGKYLFCGADVAKSLGYKDTVNALKTHCREDGVAFYHLTDNLGREQKAKFISEGNLYRLIVHSKLPSAERFEQWVFDEVLPTIRKHGAYLTKEKLWEIATSPEALLKLCSDLLAEREENVSLRIANAQLEGKAAFYDLFIDLEHSTNLRTTAKELDVPERRFVRFLLEKRFVYRTASGNVLPYAKPTNEGLFCVKDYCNHGHTMSSCSMMAQSIGSVISGTTYPSDDPEMLAVEADYAAREAQLQEKIDNIESSHSGYDEYRYNLDSLLSVRVFSFYYTRFYR